VALRPQKRVACIFCGQGPLTAEHVLPKWLQEWGLDGSGQHTLVSGEEYKTYSAPPFSASRKVVCKPCNTGWMSRLEAVSKPLLKALILGETRLIETFVQPILATWAYKTTLVQDAAVMAEQKLWPFFYEDLHLNRLPHAQAQVWTARYDWESGDGDLLSSYRARMDRRRSPDTGERLDDGPRMFTGIFTLGCVLFVTCVGHDSAQPGCQYRRTLTSETPDQNWVAFGPCPTRSPGRRADSPFRMPSSRSSVSPGRASGLRELNDVSRPAAVTALDELASVGVLTKRRLDRRTDGYLATDVFSLITTAERQLARTR